jgi:hypothetical protein
MGSFRVRVKYIANFNVTFFLHHVQLQPFKNSGGGGGMGAPQGRHSRLNNKIDKLIMIKWERIGHESEINK